MDHYTIDKIEPKKPAEGVELRAIHGERMTMAFYKLAPGAKIPEHSHPHEQLGTVLKGSLELIVEGEGKVMRSGDAYLVPPNAVHRGTCGESPAEVIEVFSPPREDFK